VSIVLTFVTYAGTESASKGDVAPAGVPASALVPVPPLDAPLEVPPDEPPDDAPPEDEAPPELDDVPRSPSRSPTCPVHADTSA
jgi:hypothetical protein